MASNTNQQRRGAQLLRSQWESQVAASIPLPRPAGRGRGRGCRTRLPPEVGVPRLVSRGVAQAPLPYPLNPLPPIVHAGSPTLSRNSPPPPPPLSMRPQIPITPPLPLLPSDLPPIPTEAPRSPPRSPPPHYETLFPQDEDEDDEFILSEWIFTNTCTYMYSTNLVFRYIC